jgi:uncharacterized protein YciI
VSGDTTPRRFGVPEITDEYMAEQLGRSRVYSLVLLRPGEAYTMDGRDELVWEHGRRNFELRAEGVLSIVGPVPEEGDLCGVGIFATSADEARRLMADDPAVQAGIFAVEVHGFRSFPGDALA